MQHAVSLMIASLSRQVAVVSVELVLSAALYVPANGLIGEGITEQEETQLLRNPMHLAHAR